jgi:hypothetical protein
MTRSRIRRTPDQGRLAQLARAPGIDSRTWAVIARVDDDEDAIRWAGPGSEDGPLGWLVDVTVQGGPLDQEPLVCRVSSAFGGDGTQRIDPIGRDCLVAVLVSEGNPNAEPTIVGVLASAQCDPPASVNGTDIDEAYAAATHILVTDHAVDEQVAGDIRVKTDGAHRILGDSVELADEGASQAFVKGNAQQSALDTFLIALNSWAAEVGAGIPTGTTPPTQAAFITAIGTLQTDLANALSTRIKGE